MTGGGLEPERGEPRGSGVIEIVQPREFFSAQLVRLSQQHREKSQSESAS